MSGEAVQAAVTALRAAYEELAALPVDTLTAGELVGVLDELETLSCQLPSQTHRLLVRLQAETTATAMGAKNWRDVLALRWRLSPTEAARRLDEAAQLGPRQTVTGDALAPVLPATALAQAHGAINREHVKLVRESMDRIPAAVDTLTRAQIEVDLVRTATGVGPKNSRTTPSASCSCSTRTAPNPTRPNAHAAAEYGKALRGWTR